METRFVKNAGYPYLRGVEVMLAGPWFATTPGAKIRKFLFWCVLILLIGGQLHQIAQGQELGLAALAKKVRPAVLLLIVMDSGGNQIAKGTGFVVSEDGMLITNKHVVKGGKQITAKAENGAYYIVDGLLAEDSANDLVVLKLQGNGFSYLPLGESQRIEAGAHVSVIGSPLGLEGSLSEGIVSAIRNDTGKGRILQITAAISPGSSGSPVLDSAGKVVGVATAMLAEGQSLNFAVPVEVGKALLSQARATSRPVLLEDKNADDDHGYFADPDYKTKFKKVNDPIEKLKLVQLLVNRYPRSAWAYFNLGQVYLELHFAGDAVDAFLKSIQNQSNFHLAWSFLCDAYRLSDRKSEAIDACQHAVILSPEESSYWYFLGQTYEDARRNNDALAAFQKAVERDPQSVESWSALGGAYRHLSRYADALVACQKAIALNGNSGEAWSCLGYAKDGSHQYEEAIAAFEQAITLKPDLTDAWYGLTLCLSFSGHHSRALKAQAELQKLDPKRAMSLSQVIMLNMQTIKRKK